MRCNDWHDLQLFRRKKRGLFVLNLLDGGLRFSCLRLRLSSAICRQNPENLLIFSAGNDGDIYDGRTVCTIGAPGIGKNVLTVGATSSGETRLTFTAEDGTVADGTNGSADIDTVAVFSSYGPTRDGRIKPEIVAPGDMVGAWTTSRYNWYSRGRNGFLRLAAALASNVDGFQCFAK